MNKKARNMLLASLAVTLCGTVVTATNVTASADGSAYEVPYGNLVTNYSVETDAAGYVAHGSTLEVTTEVAYDGASSLKVSGRTSGTWNAFNYDVTSGVEVGVEYEYSFYAYTTSESGADIQAGYSPWGTSASTSAWLWYYGAGSWAHIEANTWTKISAVFTLEEQEGKLYVVTDGADGNKNYALVKDHNGTAEDFGSLALMRLSFSATVDADIYVDCVTLTPTKIANLVTNPYFLTDAEGYRANTSTLEVSTEVTTDNGNTLKISSRTATYSAFDYDVTKGIEIGSWYEYSFTAFTPAEGGADINAGYSPWATSASSSAWLWVYGAGAWTHLEQNVAKKVSATFMLEVQEGKLYVVTRAADNSTDNYALVKDHNGTAEDFGSLALIRLSLNASAEKDLYIGDVTLKEITMAPAEDEEVAYDGPTGFGGGEDASLVPGNMVQNATFDTNMFSSELTNSGVWYYSAPEKVTINDQYSQDGTDSGYCATLSNRQNAGVSFKMRTLNIWVSNMYTYSGYVSAKEATKGAISLTMWAYNDDFTDANAGDRYPKVVYTTEFKEVKPGEWAYYEVTFGWVYNSDTKILTLQIYDGNQEGAQVVEELPTTPCTGLSVFEMGYRTDDTDANYLSDLYFDNYKLMNVTEQILGIEGEGDNSGNEGDSGNGGGIVIPGEDDETSENEGKDPGSEEGGCFSSVSALAPAALVTLLGVAFTCKKRKE